MSLLYCYHVTLLCQEVIGEIVIPDRIAFANGVVLGDSLFLDLRSDKNASRYYWIELSGKINEVDLSMVSNKSLFAVTKNNEGIAYYFLQWQNLNGKTKPILKAIWFDALRKTYSPLPEEVPLNNQRLASYIENGRLVILQVEDDGDMLSLIKLERMTIISQTKFNLPVNLKGYQYLPVHFYDRGSTPTQLTVAEPVKVYRQEGTILITIDDCRKPGVHRNPNEAYKTLVLEIDEGKPDVEAKIIRCSTKSEFRSTVSNGILYRVYHDGQINIEAYNLWGEGKLSWFVGLKGSSNLPEVQITKRFGEDFRIKTALNKKPFEIKANFVNIERTESTSEIFATIGRRFMPTSRAFIPIPGVGIVAFQSGSSGFYNSVYFRLRIEADGSYTIPKRSQTSTEKIDDFEIEFQKGKDMSYIGYVSAPNRTIGIYNYRITGKGTGKATLVSHTNH